MDSDSFSFGQFASFDLPNHRSVLDRLNWSEMNVPARSSRQEISVDNPSGNDETPTVVDERERRMREGAEWRIPGPTGPASSKIGFGAAAPRDRDSIKL